MLLLGPLPDIVRAVVERLVGNDCHDRSSSERPFLGVVLTSGPTGCSYLDVEGQVWNYHFLDESITLVPDGSLKVALVAIAGEQIPERAVWLPSRPTEALDCKICHGSGWMLAPWPRVQCPECHGLGWIQSSESLC